MEETFQAQFISLQRDEIRPWTGINQIVSKTDYIPFGSDNLFPQALTKFCRTSPNHRGIINSKHQYILGDGITSDDEPTRLLLDSVNFEGESLTEVVSPILLDDLMTGNGWVELITDKNGSFLWFNHLDTTKIRLNKDLQSAILHPDWALYKGENDPYRNCCLLHRRT